MWVAKELSLPRATLGLSLAQATSSGVLEPLVRVQIPSNGLSNAFKDRFTSGPHEP